MAVDVTTIGPVEKELRDRIAEYRDRNGYSNYNEAVRALLDQETECHR